MRIISLLFFAILISQNSFGYQEKFAMKGGVNGSYIHQQTFDISKEDLGGLGFNTHFGYRWTDWEINLSSYVSLGKFEELRLKAGDSVSDIEGLVRNVSFGPTFKYFTDWHATKLYRVYVSFGPQWALQTFKIDDSKDINIPSEQIFSEDRKITHRSIGASFSIGAEEILDDKRDYPVYIEFAYQFLVSQKVFLVDISDRKKVETIVREEPSKHNDTHIYMLNLGMTFF